MNSMRVFSLYDEKSSGKANIKYKYVQQEYPSGPGDNSVLYMMILLKELLPSLPKHLTKQCCETILKLLTLGTKIITSTGK